MKAYINSRAIKFIKRPYIKWQPVEINIVYTVCKTTNKSEQSPYQFEPRNDTSDGVNRIAKNNGL